MRSDLWVRTAAGSEFLSEPLTQTETECYGNGLTVDHRPTQLPDVLLTGQFTLKTEFKRKPQESHSERAFIL